jgi:hypothetical protein
MNESFERDPIIDRVRDTLRAAPAAKPDPRAVARVLSTVWESPKPSAWRRFIDTWRVPALSRIGASAIAAGALLAGFVTRGALVPTVADEPAPATGEFPVQQVTPVSYESAAVPTQFVLENSTATEIALVGDFNDWKVGEHKLVKLPNGLWTATIALPPGRHVYAYVLDGTLLVTDPRAPKSSDADYGREGSVVMVFNR